MRILPYMPSTEGYDPGFVGLNQDEGVLEISHPGDCQLYEDSEIIAEILTLRCTIRHFSYPQKDIRVLLISETIPLESTFLYDVNAVVPGFDRNIEQSQWQSIAVEYTNLGQGRCRDKTFTFYEKNLPLGQLEIGSPLYVKPFSTEGAPFQLRVSTIRPNQVLISPPGILNARILRGYGGYYHSGVSLEEIEQVFYSLTSEYDKTKVRLYTSSFLRSKDISPPLGGQDFSQNILFLPSPKEEEYLSFSGAIAAGYARFSVRTDFGVLYYSSFSCESVIGHPHFINIHFKPLIPNN